MHLRHAAVVWWEDDDGVVEDAPLLALLRDVGEPLEVANYPPHHRVHLTHHPQVRPPAANRIVFWIRFSFCADPDTDLDQDPDPDQDPDRDPDPDPAFLGDADLEIDLDPEKKYYFFRAHLHTRNFLFNTSFFKLF